MPISKAHTGTSADHHTTWKLTVSLQQTAATST